MWLGSGKLDPIPDIFYHAPHSVHRIVHKFLLMTFWRIEKKGKNHRTCPTNNIINLMSKEQFSILSVVKPKPKPKLL